MTAPLPPLSPPTSQVDSAAATSSSSSAQPPAPAPAPAQPPGAPPTRLPPPRSSDVHPRPRTTPPSDGRPNPSPNPTSSTPPPPDQIRPHWEPPQNRPAAQEASEWFEGKEWRDIQESSSGLSMPETHFRWLRRAIKGPWSNLSNRFYWSWPRNLTWHLLTGRFYGQLLPAAVLNHFRPARAHEVYKENVTRRATRNGIKTNEDLQLYTLILQETADTSSEGYHEHLFRLARSIILAHGNVVEGSNWAVTKAVQQVDKVLDWSLSNLQNVAWSLEVHLEHLESDVQRHGREIINSLTEFRELIRSFAVSSYLNPALYALQREILAVSIDDSSCQELAELTDKVKKWCQMAYGSWADQETQALFMQRESELVHILAVAKKMEAGQHLLTQLKVVHSTLTHLTAPEVDQDSLRHSDSQESEPTPAHQDTPILWAELASRMFAWKDIEEKVESPPGLVALRQTLSRHLRLTMDSFLLRATGHEAIAANSPAEHQENRKSSVTRLLKASWDYARAKALYEAWESHLSKQLQSLQNILVSKLFYGWGDADREHSLFKQLRSVGDGVVLASRGHTRVFERLDDINYVTCLDPSEAKQMVDSRNPRLNFLLGRCTYQRLDDGHPKERYQHALEYFASAQEMVRNLTDEQKKSYRIGEVFFENLSFWRSRAQFRRDVAHYVEKAHAYEQQQTREALRKARDTLIQAYQQEEKALFNLIDHEQALLLQKLKSALKRIHHSRAPSRPARLIEVAVHNSLLGSSRSPGPATLLNRKSRDPSSGEIQTEWMHLNKDKLFVTIRNSLSLNNNERNLINRAMEEAWTQILKLRAEGQNKGILASKILELSVSVAEPGSQSDQDTIASYQTREKRYLLPPLVDVLPNRNDFDFDTTPIYSPPERSSRQLVDSSSSRYPNPFAEGGYRYPNSSSRHRDSDNTLGEWGEARDERRRSSLTP